MEHKLYSKALGAALKSSYAPYSGIKVGAAALLDNGEIITGVNLENCSYPVSICAEQSLLCTINNLYNNQTIITIAIAAVKDGKKFEISPCGRCRQAILEWENRQQSDIAITFMNENELVIIESIRELLPYSFSEI